MIVFTATLSLIIAAVVALAGVAASSGSTHSLGDDFVLAGRHLTVCPREGCFWTASS